MEGSPTYQFGNRSQADELRTMTESTIQVTAERWVDEHGECLYRFALLRVRKPEVAEDLVQETFLAAVRGYEKFGGHSSERTWLCGILKNKIVDLFPKTGPRNFVYRFGILFR
jgi:DNA-directed RNA polymerase specialized sigma24 family protein